MKKLFVVSKTHLDLGFTDYAQAIKEKYINTFIPSAISLAAQVNTPEKKAFIWTTGSWILKEALEHGTAQQQEALRAAIRRGDIVPHAIPFTTHTELLDADTLDYGLSIVDALDELRGRKTVAAKMTDVPGHTKGLVELLAKHGVKLLHIGVNGASVLADAPPCFLWKSGEHEVVVIYSGDYGGAFQSDFTDEILYFDHTHDNHGTPSAKKVLANLKAIQKQHPDYEIIAGSMDDFADIIWEKRENLPVLTDEIGDTWIHGAASDPYKSAALRELMALKRKWLLDDTMQRGSTEYKRFTDNLLCLAEHTCGMDMKVYFADYEHYLKKDFVEARKADKVVLRHPFWDFPQNFLTLAGRMTGVTKTGFYSVSEKSWREQRDYIACAIAALSEVHQREAEQALSWLHPKVAEPIPGSGGDPYAPLQCGDWTFALNVHGGIGMLSHKGEDVIRENDAPVLEYRSYCEKDYSYWLDHYTRNLKKTYMWAVGDFARPLLKYVRGRYPAGRFPYRLQKAALSGGPVQPRICVNLICDPKLCDELGAPRMVQIVYELQPSGLQMDVSWFGKDASRLTEAIFLRMFPAAGSLRLRKINTWINPDEVVSMGGRNLHAVMGAVLHTEHGGYRFHNRHAPLLSIGRGKILEFDNQFEDIGKDGITYVLYDNVWGTNFPLWYEENARFRFVITADGHES